MSPESANKSKRSPWVWAIVGCSFLVLFGFGGCLAGVGFLGHRVYREARKPVQEEDIIAALGDIPIYKPSEFDPELTRVMRGSTAFLPSDLVTHAAFSTPDSQKRVLAWYKAELTNVGYEADPSGLQLNTFLNQTQFSKGPNRLILQLQSSPDNKDGRTAISMSFYQFLEPTESSI